MLTIATLNANSGARSTKRFTTRFARRPKWTMPTSVHVIDNDFSLSDAKCIALMQELDRFYGTARVD